MKRFYLLILLIGILFAGCNSIPNKSILKKLSDEEQASARLKDADFPAFYDATRAKVDSMPDSLKTLYEKITYKKLFEYDKFLNDTAFWKDQKSKWEEEWDGEHMNALTSCDSVLNHWKEIKDANSLSGYASVKLDSIAFDGKGKYVFFRFKVTPLKGTLNGIYFKCYDVMTTKGFRSNDTLYYYDSFTTFSKTTYIVKKISSKNVKTKSLDQKNAKITITDVWKNGKRLKSKDFKIPADVLECLNLEESNAEGYDAAKTEYIQKNFDENYVSLDEYVMEKSNVLKKSKGGICYGF